jgi:hypothetical protein
MLLKKLPEVANVPHTRKIVEELDMVPVLDYAEQFDEVERISSEVPRKADVHLDSFWVYPKDLSGDVLQLLEIEFVRHPLIEA